MKLVHTKNRRNYSVQPDRSEQGKGKTRTRPCRPSSRKKYLEEARVFPHSPRSLPTTFDINSEPELIQGGVLGVEPIWSGIHRSISVPLQFLVQSSQVRGVGNINKPLAGIHELLLTHQELSGSGEYQKTLRRLESIVFQRQFKKIKNWLINQSLLSKDQKKELEMTPSLEIEGPVASTSSQKTPEQSKEKSKGPQKKQIVPKNKKVKQKGKTNWHRQYPQWYRIPKLEHLAIESFLNMARTLMGFTARY
ncbi:hypothetical protein O181_041770 [Austropuccinia psidii MF-1]|uniref:Uncharacterized protein n=1 Tax=Austropuccinia psidii MF-1 TaxID=1389203 RepID=A0A9Q3DJB8_9BASI|nr:hypothetical protein [Austropuccinia psidii MF-1]